MLHGVRCLVVVRFQQMIRRQIKALSIKPILWGLGVALLGLILAASILHFWLPSWVEGLDYYGLGADGVIEKIRNEQYYSPPYLAFLFVQAVGWFLGGLTAARRATNSLVLHSIGVGVVGTVIFFESTVHTKLCSNCRLRRSCGSEYEI